MARHIFFSYAHADTDRLLPFYNILQQRVQPQRHLIWIDRGLVGGDLWENRIRLAIQNSYAIIFAITKTFIEREFILDKEIPWSFERFPATLDISDRLPIFPILLDPLPDRWESKHTSLKRLSEVQYVDAIGQDIDLVVQDLLKLLPIPPSSTSFIVTWPRLLNFKGRKETLDQLHTALKNNSKAGMTTIATLYGTGGVGKTQLAVEYAHQYQPEYPGGVFWINAAEDLQKELVTIAERLNLKPLDPSDIDRNKQLVLALREYLRQQQANKEETLIILDNIERPDIVSELQIAPKMTLEELCMEATTRLLMTTRVTEIPKRFTPVSVNVLRPNDALEVLLDAWTSDDVPRRDSPDKDVLADIACQVGYLPLALGWMAAALRERHDLSPTELRDELQLLGIDEVAKTLETQGVKLGTPGNYEALVSKALDWQLRQLSDNEAKRLLALIAAFPDAVVVPCERVRLLASLSEKGLRDPFITGIRDLQKYSLIETLEDGAAFRLHPLTHEYCRRMLDTAARLSEAASALTLSYRIPAVIDAQTRTRGFLNVVDDLVSTKTALRVSNPELNHLERLFRMEEKNLLQLPAPLPSAYIVQQIRNRAFHEKENELCLACDEWLNGKLHASPLSGSRYPAGALLQILQGHTGDVSGALELREGRLLSWSHDTTLRLWNTEGRELAVLRGHTSFVSGALELRDGRLLSWSYDNTLRLWNMEGRELAVLRDHKSVDSALELRDGRLLSWGSEGTLRLWSAEGREPVELQGHTDSVYGALELRDGRLLSWGSEGTLRLWSAEGREPVELQGHTDSVYGALELRDGRLLSWGFEGTLRLWSAEGREPVELQGHTDSVFSVLELRDGRLLSLSEDRRPRLWSTEGRELVELRGHSVLELRDGRLLSWGWEHALRLWNTEGRELAVLRGHTDYIAGALELHDGRLLSWSHDYSLRLWSAEGRELAVLRGHANIEGALELRDGRLLSWGSEGTLRLWSIQGYEVAVPQAHAGSVRGAIALRDGRLLSWGVDGTLRLWSTEGYEIARLLGHSRPVESALELRDGRLLSWGVDGTLRLWSAEGRDLAVLRNGVGNVYGALELRDGRLLSWGQYSAVRLWSTDGKEETALGDYADYGRGALELRDGRLLSWSDGKAMRLSSADGHELALFGDRTSYFSGALELRDGRLLSWSHDTTLRLWNAEGHEVGVLQGHTNGVTGALELRDGRLLSWSHDTTLRLWNAEGHEVGVLQGHTNGVTGALELRDGRLLSWPADRAIIGEDNTLRLWSTEGRALAVLQGHTNSVGGAIELEDGRFLSWSADGTLRLWSLKGELLGIYSNDNGITCCILCSDHTIAIGDTGGRIVMLEWLSSRVVV